MPGGISHDIVVPGPGAAGELIELSQLSESELGRALQRSVYFPSALVPKIVDRFQAASRGPQELLGRHGLRGAARAAHGGSQDARFWIPPDLPAAARLAAEAAGLDPAVESVLATVFSE